MLLEDKGGTQVTDGPRHSDYILSDVTLFELTT